MKLIKFFVPKAKRGFADPQPAKKFIPDWYKKAEISYMDQDKVERFGLKACMPYLDSLMSGYIITTPVDIFVNEETNEYSHIFNNEDSLSLKWDGPPEFASFIKERPKESGATMPRPAGHHPNHLVFEGFWSVKTPRGYSLLMTHPLNRYDLPFTISSGIIDSDKFFASGNIPFFIRKDFKGVIPQGTPIAQLIPIKRDSWNMVENDAMLTEQDMLQGFLVRQKETNYKKTLWQRKSYS